MSFAIKTLISCFVIFTLFWVFLYFLTNAQSKMTWIEEMARDAARDAKEVAEYNSPEATAKRAEVAAKEAEELRKQQAEARGEEYIPPQSFWNKVCMWIFLIFVFIFLMGPGGTMIVGLLGLKALVGWLK